MTTFNEKRAHDLAMLSTEFALNHPEINGDREIKVNVYDIYKKGFDLALHAMNRDYSDGQS